MELQNGRPADAAGRMDKEIRTYDFLDGLGVDYQRMDHEAAFTMEACKEVDEALGVEMCKNLFAFPVSRKDDFFPVRAYMIVFCRYLRGIVFELASPGISYVDIDRITVTVQLPNARHLKVIPTFVVEISLIKVGRSCICMSYPVEFPRTVQGHEIR